jgi:hypothetical protein
VIGTGFRTCAGFAGGYVWVQVQVMICNPFKILTCDMGYPCCLWPIPGGLYSRVMGESGWHNYTVWEYTHAMYMLQSAHFSLFLFLSFFPFLILVTTMSVLDSFPLTQPSPSFLNVCQCSITYLRLWYSPPIMSQIPLPHMVFLVPPSQCILSNSPLLNMPPRYISITVLWDKP